MDVYEDPATWKPEPVRPRRQLIPQFLASVVFFPVFCGVFAAVFAVLLAIGLFTEALAIVSDRYERAFLRMMDRTAGRLLPLASWCVTWPELRHEGDTAFYRARVDKVVGNWTKRASAPAEPKKPKPPVECEIPLRAYRGVGGGYVAEVALAQGWELRPSDVRREVRLWWSAAS
ncbi:hypothetical protein [Streptomyces sp. SCSIO ZS0520]|uniref:hypothetical protein n=1 Tax=Streptomyces sp. SCSIO ZS0520 TaxID=2892996 RepID=UPI0021D90BE4|nr:hypothetical protein [Streptomyces sp. SCSIO ZS0520]